ncbi:MAG: hypothetical protein K6C37_06735, partial [Bacteroidales bacterium]|nr:hypothetical protein [Bacteroidales bacterium]
MGSRTTQEILYNPSWRTSGGLIMTFGEYWPNWIEHKRLFVRDSSIAAYSTRWRMHLAGYFSDIDMDSL